MSAAATELRERLAELIDLRNAAHLLEWDQQTMMPPRGVGVRAESLATLERISHERFIDAEVGRLIDAAARETADAPPDSDAARLVSVARRHWDKVRRVPTELASEIARASSVGHEAWVAARAASDFDAFAPYLEHNLELARRYAECLPEFDDPYDALLDDYEPGLRSADVRTIFADLASELVPLIARVGEAPPVDDDVLHAPLAEARQREIVARILARMGFERERWRLDEAAHPFATSFGRDDVRLTTRWDEAFFPTALYSAMHECGHGLYESGIAPELERTPLGHVESLSLHESQSRLWENMVGRSRAFASVLAPLLSEASGSPVDADALFKAVNRVSPSFIRVEADEATYGMHVVLRFELEHAMVNGQLTVAELPEAWNARFAKYLGLTVTDPAKGVLQDVHWSAGSIGYFPTYALGNLIAGQLWQRVNDDLPDLQAQIAAGELGTLREWLRENVHRHGAKFSMPELVERVIGEPIAVTPFVSYLKDKLTEVYGVDLRG